MVARLQRHDAMQTGLIGLPWCVGEVLAFVGFHRPEVFIEPEDDRRIFDALSNGVDAVRGIRERVATADSMQIDLFPVLGQEANDVVFHHVRQQRRQGISAVVDDESTVSLVSIFHERIEPLRVDGAGFIHHRDMLGTKRLVMGKRRVFLIGIEGFQVGPLRFEELREHHGDERFSDTALALQDEMNDEWCFACWLLISKDRRQALGYA
ncbi:MAG: hypothetical protein CBARDCOR_3595 [uncultured Caballeronia sp.]|nr:MAG: hypothetical protein CBARDCOR_3595 [uncultured Caballeronia sp.]